jgi:hypothetical protein
MLANAKHFQISVVPMPSFSKESLGGFEGFQRVTIDPNQKSCIFQIFEFRMGSNSLSFANPSGEKRKPIKRRHSIICYFPKEESARKIDIGSPLRSSGECAFLIPTAARSGSLCCPRDED